MPEFPLVSVIISVLNGRNTLQTCIDSIISQTYPNIELIIIDGHSTDGTVEILRSNTHNIQYWKSAPDNGIYDAWNKGLLIAKGSWICFIGSDDRFSSKDTISKLICSINESNSNASLISGLSNYLDENGNSIKVIGEKWDWNKNKYFQRIAHPGTLHKAELFRQYGYFNAEFKIAGDYDFLCRLDEHVETIFVDEVIVNCGIYGVSNTRVNKGIHERFIIHIKNRKINILLALWHYIRGYLLFILSVQFKSRVISF